MNKNYATVLAEVRAKVRQVKEQNKMSELKVASYFDISPWTHTSLMQGNDIRASSLIKIMLKLGYDL